MNQYKRERNPMRSAVIVLFLVSCATQAPAVHFSPVYVTDRSRFTLLPAAALERPLDGPQQFTGTFGDRAFIMDAWVRAGATGIEMALYSGMGSTLGHFSFTDERISFESPVFPPNFKPEYLAADFQFCFYRPDALEEALRASGLVFERTVVPGVDGEYTETRRISEGNTLIIEIEKQANVVRYTNLLRGYAYTLAGAL